jgi:hypothetical protein
MEETGDQRVLFYVERMAKIGETGDQRVLTYAERKAAPRSMSFDDIMMFFYSFVSAAVHR